MTNRIKPDWVGRQIKKGAVGKGVGVGVKKSFHSNERKREEEKRRIKLWCWTREGRRLNGEGDQRRMISLPEMMGKAGRRFALYISSFVYIESAQYFVCIHSCSFIHGRVMLLPLAL